MIITNKLKKENDEQKLHVRVLESVPNAVSLDKIGDENYEYEKSIAQFKT
ncbi:hypothetical protein J2Y02_001129 [Neobacillus drentensis]|nr:hypothetical protein [Neobacillus drentensis]